jgi:hypothetical protein
VLFPFSLCGDFRSHFLDFPWGSFGGVSLRDSCWMSCMRGLCASLLGDLALTNPPKRLQFGGFL